MFSCEFSKFLRSIFFAEHLGTTTSEISTMGFAIKNSVAYVLKSDWKNEKLRSKSYFW